MIASYAYSITQVVVNLIYVPVLLSGIGQAEYGLYQTIGSIIAYLSVVSSTFSAGAARYYTKFYVLGDEDGMANTLGILKRLYRIADALIIIFTIVCGVTVCIVYRSSFSAWEIQESCMMLAVLAANLMISLSNTIPIASITAHEEFAFLKISQLTVLVLQPALVVALIQSFPCALTITVAQFICNVLCYVLQYVFARRRLNMDTRPRVFDKELAKRLITFSGTIVLALVADQIFWRSDQLILSYMYGTSATAIYAVGSQVVNTYLPLGVAASSVFLPRVSELWLKNRDLDGLSRLFVKVSRITLYPLLAVLLGFIVLGQDFIRLWAGESYGEAWWVCVLELVPFTIDVSQNIGLTILQVMNCYGFRAKMYFVAAMINIGFTVCLAGTMGITGAALASGLAMLVSSGLILNWYYQRRIGLDMMMWWRSTLREIAPMIVLCVVAWFAWQSFSGCGWGVLIAGVIAWAVAFTVVSYFLCANAYERDLVKSIVRKVIRK